MKQPLRRVGSICLLTWLLIWTASCTEDRQVSSLAGQSQVDAGNRDASGFDTDSSNSLDTQTQDTANTDLSEQDTQEDPV
ncbi:MAG: hypothetical protein KC561_18365, partial [Myxococcales bacterium]|nr:hypothetical protein [Myxococcales bacterium]